MSQQWLSAIGVALDFLGFCILLVEWWLAFFNEERQLGFQRQLEQERNRRAMFQSNAPETMRKHLETSGKMMDDMAVRRAWEMHTGAMGRRKTAFIAAAVLIVVGSGLQFLGAAPGCCAMLGIVPQT